MEEYNIESIDLLKLDCEGGENGFLRDDCEDLDILKKTRVIMGEWHGFEDYSPDAPTQSTLFNKLNEILKDSHESWFYDPVEKDGLGIFGFAQK